MNSRVMLRGSLLTLAVMGVTACATVDKQSNTEQQPELVYTYIYPQSGKVQEGYYVQLELENAQQE